jgi:hypothetical protein
MEGITMQTKLIIPFLLMLLLVCAAGCQKQESGEVLVQTNTLPVIDGVIGKSEYQVMMETEKIVLHLSRDSENLVFGLAGQTTGWIAVGFGSLDMDTSHIIIGYSDGDTMMVKEHEGIGHGHLEAEKQICENALLTEKNGKTIFEGIIPASDVIREGQTSLLMIIACGLEDNVTSRHTFRKSMRVPLTGE